MNIIEHNWKWNGGLSARQATNAIVLHHAATETASAEDIDRIHKGNGWSGIGYHFYVRKNGDVHRGRPEWAAGAHVLNHNGHTIGVCAEGNYEVEENMPAAQLVALRELVAMLREKYPGIDVKQHKNYMATACPGINYPFDAITQYGEDEDMTRYNTVAEMPEYYRAEAQKLIDSGALRGDADGNLGVSEDMLRGMIVGMRYVDEKQKRYDSVESMPTYYREEAQKLVDRGALKGRGDGNLDVSDDMIRTMIICQRMLEAGK